MKTALAALALSVLANTPAETPRNELAAVCFKSGEQLSGMNKICYYNCMGSTVAITISSVQLCPLTING